jgi:hypothetical protein
LLEQRIPSIVADSHFVTSSDEPGKVKIDPDTGIMAVNGLDYSLDEVNTGAKWIDGKPIYKRTFQVTSPADATGTSFPLASGVDTALDHTFMLIRSDGVKTTARNFFGTSSGLFQFTSSINVSSGDMSVVINIPQAGALYLNRPCIVTVWYTKTTD